MTVVSRLGIARRDAARAVRHGRIRVLDQQARHRREDIHLLARPRGLVDRGVDKGAAAPVEAAHAARGAARALRDGGLSRGLEDGQDRVLGEGRDLGDDGEPAVHIALEGEHVGRAGAGGVFAGDLVRGVFRFGEEVLERCRHQFLDAVLPNLRSIRLCQKSV